MRIGRLRIGNQEGPGVRFRLEAHRLYLGSPAPAGPICLLWALTMDKIGPMSAALLARLISHNRKGLTAFWVFLCKPINLGDFFR